MKVGIVGAGIAGRLVALECRRRDWLVHLFDSHGLSARGCSFVAAGQLAPYCELDSADPLIHRLGRESLTLWPGIIAALESEVFFQKEGTLVVACAADQPELQRLERRVAKVMPGEFRICGGALRELEPELDPRFTEALFFPEEGQLANRELLAALGAMLLRLQVRCDWRAVEVVAPGQIRVGAQGLAFDWVVDCRGLAAGDAWTGLRGVRGEMVYVHAPEVTFSRPVRLAHPRYPLYVAPRPGQLFLLGATCLESEDDGPVRVRSALELLSAAYSLHSGFGEARIEEWVTGVRPVLPHHQPRVRYGSRLLRVNGMYRHGYLVGPRMAELVADFIGGKEPPSPYDQLWEKAV